MSDSTKGQQIDSVNNGQVRFEPGNNRIVQYDGSNNRSLMGSRNNVPGFYVSKEGIDVETADDDQLIFNSNQNVFKIILTDTAVVTLPPGYGDYVEYTVDITHGYGNTPMVVGSVDFPSATNEGKFMLPITLVETTGGTTGVAAFFRVKQNYFTCTVKARNSGADTYEGDYTFKYYILQETAA